MNEPLTLKIDSREQRPYKFDLPVVVGKLDQGDYSLVGFESRVGIERKSLNDLISSLSFGRDRFQRELQRGPEMPYFALICECSMDDILRGRYRSRMTPASVLGSLEAYSVRFGLPVFYCGNRESGQRVTQSLLLKYHKEVEKFCPAPSGQQQKIYALYEARKAELQNLNLSPGQYEQAIAVLADEPGV